MLDDFPRGEVAEQQLDVFIARRAGGATGRDQANAAEALWRSSVDRHHARRREENREGWIAHFELLAENHARLAEENRSKAAALMGVEDETKGGVACPTPTGWPL